jgi:hypothetical protein
VKGRENKQTTQTNGFLSDDTKLVNLKKTKKLKQTQRQRQRQQNTNTNTENEEE